jgi:endonuclease/exonuclease/phosphatase family metal-dependent hydrolase
MRDRRSGGSLAIIHFHLDLTPENRMSGAEQLL